MSEHATHIELNWTSQRLDLRHGKEDWTGKTSPLERRKLQNRLNQRARRMRANETVNQNNSSISKIFKKSPATRSGPDESNSGTLSSSTSHGAISPAKPGCMAATQQVQEIMQHFAQHAYMSYMQGTPSIAHLALLVKYNVSSALQRNADILGVKAEYFEWDGISPFSSQNFKLAFVEMQNWPTNLLPTKLQCSIEHHPWVDVFPWPKLRDNMLQAFQHPDICDEDEMCREIVEYEDVNSKPLLIVWGDASDPRNWEVTPEFLTKWGWLLSGCEDFLEATNHWRGKRNEPLLSCQEVREALQASIPARLQDAEL
ncbi:hypothetical protein HBI25_047380 [Parastagonospora nodorum]|nr:hypothetical protein HBH52_227620 [Parastagonospora nodorum]KAH4415092.1 hypothetical protein HBH92_073380 [Parastagonospora nodorum]KAH4440417.1 hypothetical protein HBH93_087940 [Parastagonospora nodorum]KAH4451868.1 hypothetical protein HBH91_116180 [Parastagonospora nodorum]KAH4481943.1 hypothetical protein HBH89_244430 [Parastagonospora nodorum]